MAKNTEKKQSIAAGLTDAQRKGIKAIKAGRKPNVGQLSSLRRAKLVKKDGDLSASGKRAAASIARSEASKKPKKKKAAPKKAAPKKKAAKKGKRKSSQMAITAKGKRVPKKVQECAVILGHHSRGTLQGVEIVYV